MISCHLIGLRKTKTLLRPQKDYRSRENGGDVAFESRSKDTHDTIESFHLSISRLLELAENSIEKSFSLFFFAGITSLTEAREL